MAKGLRSINPRAADVGENLLEQLIERLGESWNRLRREDQQLIRQCAEDAGTLALAALIAPQTPEDQAWLANEKKQIHAQLMNIGSAEAMRVATEFWSVVKSVVQGAVTIALVAV